MTEESLRVDAVDIRRAPGFSDGGFPVEDLSAGINVVHGPNASGKTTLARAVQWLLWPDSGSERARLTGHLSRNEEAWRVDVDRGRVSYQRDGQDANGPNLPPPDQRDRYRLSLHDLLQHETRNESFANAIERESAGGYDVSAARDALGFDDSPSTRGKGVVKAAEGAIEDWRDANQTVEALRGERDRLATLRSDLADAKAASNRVRLLEQAIEYARARNELAEARAALEEFPDVLSRIAGDETERIDSLDDRIGEWESKRADARERLDAARERLSEADLPDDGLPDGFVDRLEDLASQLESLEDTRRQHEATRADLETQREKAVSEISLDVDEDDLATLDPGAWEDVAEFARTAEEVRARREMQNAVEQWLDGGARPDAELSELQRGARALEDWLASPPADAAGGRDAFRIAIVSAASLATASVALGILVAPALFLTVLVAVGIFLYGYRVRDGATDVGRGREQYRATVEELDVESPGSWTESDVRARLRDVYGDIADHELANQRERRLDAHEADRAALTEREETLEARRVTVRERLGAAPDDTDVELTVLARRILRWQEAHDRVLGLREKIDTVEDQIETVRTEIEAALEPYGYEDVSDAATATERIRALESRGRKHDDATGAIERAEETIAEAEAKIQALESERASVFVDVGLEPDEDDRLRTLCERSAAYQDARSTVDSKEEITKREEADLEALPGYEPEIESRDVASLREAKREAEATAETHDEVLAEIQRIEADIDTAKENTTVEDALTEKERALADLRDQLDEDCAEMVGHVLTEHVQSATNEASRPAVFRHARDVLVRITSGRYELLLAEDDDTFRAYDTVREKGFALDELSSATRLQVLLAVRLAFVEHQEQGVQLPLLLDETLANTDDAKADVLIDAMIEFARSGRQVFYFTAQGDEVAKWNAALEDAANVDHSVIDLDEIRDANGRVDVPELAAITVETDSPPDPDGHDHASYGDELDVPAFDPRQGSGNAHLWYLVDDLELLSHLLDVGIERWGQLDAVLSGSGSQIVADDTETLERLRRRGAALEEFVRSWQTGRGERVDRQVLEDADSVSENFVDDVAVLAERVDGDAERIVERLRAGDVNRFRENKMDELERYFEENGYIEPAEPLDPGQIRLRVMERLARNGVPREETSERARTLIDRFAR